MNKTTKLFNKWILSQCLSYVNYKNRKISKYFCILIIKILPENHNLYINNTIRQCDQKKQALFEIISPVAPVQLLIIFKKEITLN